MLNPQLANHIGPIFKINEFRLQFDDGQQVINQALDLSKGNNLQFVVGFEDLPDAIQRFRVVADIRKRDTASGISGEFIVNRRATTIDAIVDLEGDASRVTVEIEHDHPEVNEGEIPEASPFDPFLRPFHLGPGIYDLVAELTPMDGSGLREDLRIGLSYNFNGFIAAAQPEGSPAAFENALQPETAPQAR
jgi:hypothetical protein